MNTNYYDVDMYNTIKPRVVKNIPDENHVTTENYNILLSEAKGKQALVAARSILSTEILKRLKPLGQMDYSPIGVCDNIMNNINLEVFGKIEDSKILESVLYNELYKVALEIQYTKGIDSTKDMELLMESLKPVINNVIVLLGRV